MMFRASLTVAFTCASLCAVLAQQKTPTVPPTKAASPTIPASAMAMMPAPAASDVVFIKAGVGSFKVVPKGPDAPPAGRLEFSFSGTVLITGLEPGSYLQTTGKVEKQYEETKHGKQVYFGKGKILLVGKFRNCEWFGRDLNLRFQGSAIFRMSAEFDSNFDTGTFIYEGDKKAFPLQTSLTPIYVPKMTGGPMDAITREEFEAAKKKKKGG
jgi:hypothetical protein